MRQLITATTALLALLPADALACGGFFCNNTDVDQSAERILFAVDEEGGEVTAHVQITYQGEAPDFAWIVPVPAVPELQVGTDQLFAQLGWRTDPTFQLEYVEKDRCVYDAYSTVLDYASSSPSAPSSGGVDVVAEQQVGPYDTVTLQATDESELLTWLQDNGYQLPDDLDPVLAPYVASGSYFVALRLQNDKSVGDLQPLAMTYTGTAVSIPVQLTSIAATPDMRLEVYVLGESRAVPESYLHVRINDAAIDWFGGGGNYEDVITLAANEAGGHAFATDHSGSTQPLHGSLYVEGRYDTDYLATLEDPVVFMDEVIAQALPADSVMLSILREFLPIPDAIADSVDEQSFYNCVACYAEYLDPAAFDEVGCAAAIEERIVAPLRDTEQLLKDHDHITRLTSSLDAVEMTVDPTFVFNDDMVEQEVATDRHATVIMHCGDGGLWSEAPRELVLADGRAIWLPSEAWFRAVGITEYEYMSDLMGVNALIIEQTGAEGEPEVLFDYTDEAFAETQAFNGEPEASGAGCGCATSGGFGWTAWLLGLGLVGLRRRR